MRFIYGSKENCLLFRAWLGRVVSELPVQLRVIFSGLYTGPIDIQVSFCSMGCDCVSPGVTLRLLKWETSVSDYEMTATFMLLETWKVCDCAAELGEKQVHPNSRRGSIHRINLYRLFDYRLMKNW